MKRKWTYIAGAALLLIFAGFSLASFKDALTPYVSYQDAVAAPDRTVQIAGGLVEGSSAYDDATGLLHFTLHDPESGETLPVRYEGLKPANFEEAISIVAIGSYDTASSDFRAHKLLVKCPSKYQGAEVKEYG